MLFHGQLMLDDADFVQHFLLILVVELDSGGIVLFLQFLQSVFEVLISNVGDALGCTAQIFSEWSIFVEDDISLFKSKRGTFLLGTFAGSKSAICV